MTGSAAEPVVLVVLEAVFCPFFCSGLTIACLVSILDFGDLEQVAISSHFGIPKLSQGLLNPIGKIGFKTVKNRFLKGGGQIISLREIRLETLGEDIIPICKAMK